MPADLAERVSLNIPETLLVSELIKGADEAGRGSFPVEAHGPGRETHGRMAALKKKGVVTSEVRDGVTRYALHPEFLARNRSGIDVRESAF